MTEPSPAEALTALFEKTGHAHHEAFAATDGADPDWPIWYANYLQKPVAPLIGEHTLTELVVALVDADSEYQARAPDEPWPVFYSKFLRERYVSELDEKLALYYIPTCPFCVRVLRVIDELDIDVELRDIWTDEKSRAELMEARGRTTVPVLRCTSAKRDRWMPESADIVRYLRERFGTTSNAAE